ncbi:MAG: hypothetical protein ACI9OJ_000735 [Myxococcota bacterium]
MRSLNPDDRQIVFGFGEEAGVSVVCNIPGFNEPWTGLNDKLPSEQDKLNSCYTTDRRYVLGEDGIAAATWPSALTGSGGLQGQTGGRANLWTAIKTSFDFMKTQAQANRHIVIFTDGPDTCQPAGDYQHCLKGQAQPPCDKSTDYAAAKNAVLAYQTELGTIGRNAVAAGVHVSFIHIQSRGYKESSPQMQELACLTGGHYIFVNAAQLSYAQSEQRNPIEAAANELRLTLGGHYGLVADIAPLSAPAGTPASARARFGRNRRRSRATSVS